MRISFILVAATASLLSSASFAGERLRDQAGAGAETARSAGTQPPARAGTRNTIRLPSDASRDLMPTTVEAERRFTLVGHKRDGKELRLVPTAEILKSLTARQP